MNLRDLTPPVFADRLRKARHGAGKLYGSYESALGECEAGYEEDSIVAVVREKTRRYRDVLASQRPLICEMGSLRTLVSLILAAGFSKDLHVIDFGGACGAHFFEAKALLHGRVNLHWHVVETPKMALAAADLEEDGLQFYDDLEKAKDDLERLDMVFTSFALPYAPQPYEMLKRLTECGASHLFVTRVPLSTTPHELVTVQTSYLSSNGPGPMPVGMKDGLVQYPITYARKDRCEEIISKNYEIRIQFNEERDFYSSGKYAVDLYGYFGVLRTSNPQPSCVEKSRGL